MNLTCRDARPGDMAQLQKIRNSVRENRLSDPGRITTKDYEEFLFHRGRGWVCETESGIAGFAVLDLQERNIWALFVDPSREGVGIGRELQSRMLDWYFSQYSETLWLSTAPRTRAESFYRKSGWQDRGLTAHGEIRFEMSRDCWQQAKDIG